jgi:curved DNA-binding protein CbpA
VLGFQAGSVVTADMVESRFRELAMQHHPDKGGNSDKFRQLVSARDAARQHFEGGR